MFSLYVTQPPAEHEAAYRPPLARTRRRPITRQLRPSAEAAKTRRQGAGIFAALVLTFLGAGIYADSNPPSAHGTQAAAGQTASARQLDN